jgi:hypothetical protein
MGKSTADKPLEASWALPGYITLTALLQGSTAILGRMRWVGGEIPWPLRL